MRVTTGCDPREAGGRADAFAACAPRTLFCVGVTGATDCKGAFAASEAGTLTADFSTGVELVRVLVGTAVMAPGTLRLA